MYFMELAKKKKKKGVGEGFRDVFFSLLVIKLHENLSFLGCCQLRWDCSSWWNPPWHGEGDYLTKRFQPVHQQEELVGAMLVRLIRTNKSS